MSLNSFLRNYSSNPRINMIIHIYLEKRFLRLILKQILIFLKMYYLVKLMEIIVISSQFNVSVEKTFMQS